ncbi:MAG: nitroreductase [Gaiellales bacterium]|jgi:nitroreductase|nr:nitroreductase [Gaiellales bacterium]
MELEQAIRGRRTNKVYRPEPVPRPVLEELFELARWAPNHHLTNPWRFRVVGPRSLERLKQADPDGARKLDRAPTLIAVSAVQTGDELADEEDLLASAVAAYIVLLAAHARGIASYWRTPRVLRTQEGRDALGMPAGERVIGLLHLGYSDREWSPPPRADAGEVVRFLE